MRLWPIAILDQLPRQQLLGQHRECCALRGKGWGRKHATVDYVFTHPYWFLYEYHFQVMLEMLRRKFQPDKKWWDHRYRGNVIGYDESTFTDKHLIEFANFQTYPEHDAAYLSDCIDNLRRKGVDIKLGTNRV